jgi:competence protein ComEA
VALAAFALGCALLALALPWPDREPPPCRAPREAAARLGHTTVVRCDGQGPGLRGPARLLFGLRLDPNRADARALEVLPGIGPSRAAAIVAERERRPFRDVADLRRVPGIGPVTLRRIEPWLAVAGTGEAGASLPQNR